MQPRWTAGASELGPLGYATHPPICGVATALGEVRAAGASAGRSRSLQRRAPGGAHRMLPVDIVLQVSEASRERRAAAIWERVWGRAHSSAFKRRRLPAAFVNATFSLERLSGLPSRHAERSTRRDCRTPARTPLLITGGSALGISGAKGARPTAGRAPAGAARRLPHVAPGPGLGAGSPAAAGEEFAGVGLGVLPLQRDEAFKR